MSCESTEWLTSMNVISIPATDSAQMTEYFDI